MKKNFIFLFILMVVTISAFAQVTLPHYEGFDYTAPGVLQTQPNWTLLNTGDDIVVASGNLGYTGLQASTGNKITFDGTGIDALKTITEQTTGTVYYSLLIDVTALGSLNATGGYLCGFANGTTNFGATLWTGLDGTSYQFGINPRTSTTVNMVWIGGTQTLGNTVFIVVSYEIVTGAANDIINIWINPDSGTFGDASPPTSSTSVTNTGGTDLATIQSFFVRQDSGTETPFIEMDEVRVGTTWADVTPAGTSTPDIALANLPAQVIAGDVEQGTSNHPLAIFQAVVTSADATLTGVNLNALGSYTGTDITGLKLWYNTSNTMTAATEIGAISPSGTGAYSFTALTQQITSGSTGYFFITAEVSATAIVTRTITITGIVPVFALGSPTGTVADGGAQTIVAAPVEEVDWCNLQWPDAGTITVGGDYDVYARVYEPGITDGIGQGIGINVWIGYSSTDTDPSTWTDWVVATYNVDDGVNNDEYMANIGTSLTEGTYYYASKFQIDGSIAFTYGGYNGGFWDGTTNVSGVLTVNPVVPSQIVITNVTPASPIVDQTFTLTVQSQEGTGTATNVTVDELITLSDASSNGILSGTLTGTITAGTNSVTFTGLSYDYVETVSIQAQSTNYGNDDMLVTIQDAPIGQTVHFDNDAAWIQDGAIAFGSYGNHGYQEFGATFSGTNVLRNGIADQDGFPGALDVYSFRLRNVADSKLAITIVAGGVGDFSLKVRRWDGTPTPDFTVKYSVNGGTDWTSLTNIDGTLLTTSDWFTYSGTINNAANNILIEIQNTGTTERIMIDDFTWVAYGAPSTNPEITGISINPTSPTPADDVVVTATITDDGTISDASIDWGTSTGNLPNNVPMTLTKGIYTGTIPMQIDGTTVYYIVSATDDQANTTISDEMNYTVVEPTIPTQLVITSVTPVSPIVNTAFSLTVEAQDGAGTISNVTSDTEITLTKLSGGVLTGTLVLTMTSGTSSVTFTDLNVDAIGDVVIRATPTTGMTTLTVDEVTIAIQDIPTTPAVFFSEYIEGNSSNKALEIYNGTSADVDLSLFVIKQANNGNGWGNTSSSTDDTRYILPLTGTLAAGDVLVLANSAANADILAVADYTYTYNGTVNGCEGCNVLSLNGDDAVGLFFNGVLIDIIGTPDIDPGTGWPVGGQPNATMDTTLVRKYPDVTVGTDDWALSAGTTIENSQWEIYFTDVTDYLGWHGEQTTDPTVNITYPADGGTVPSTDINVTFSVQNFAIPADGYIEYTYDGGITIFDHNTTDPIAITGLTDGNAYTLTMELVDGLGDPLPIPAIDEVTFTVNVPVSNDVANIAELRLGLTDGTIYTLTGEAVITYQRTSRNQKYIQDATGGILIDDNAGIITTVYNQYDGVTGITGTLYLYNGLLEFIPTANTSAATSTGNVVTPQVVTITDLSTIETYESELINLDNVTFVEAGVFAAATNYNLTDGTNTIVFRTSFAEANYIGQPIPTQTLNVTAFVQEFNGTVQIVARDLDDFVIGTEPYLIITSPGNNVTLTANDVDIEFTVGNFVVANGTGDGHIHYTINGGSVVMIYNTDPISLTGLADDIYTVDMWLVDNAHQPLVPAVEASVTFEVDAVGIDGINSQYVIYPNPANSVLNINVNSTINNIEIVDIIGKTVYSSLQNSENVKVDISSLSNGVYILNISTDNGRIIEKIIKN
jgi:hypothetical protein